MLWRIALLQGALACANEFDVCRTPSRHFARVAQTSVSFQEWSFNLTSCPGREGPRRVSVSRAFDMNEFCFEYIHKFRVRSVFRFYRYVISCKAMYCLKKVGGVFTTACIRATEDAIINEFSHRIIHCIGNAVAQSTFVSQHGSLTKTRKSAGTQNSIPSKTYACLNTFYFRSLFLKHEVDNIRKRYRRNCWSNTRR